MNGNFDTKELLDSILSDTRTYKSKLEQVKVEIERKHFSRDTKFMCDVTARQSEQEEFLADKFKEAESLRQSVKYNKDEIAQAIELFKGELLFPDPAGHHFHQRGAG